MFAFVTAPESTIRAASPEVRVTAHDPGELCWPTSLGTGITVAVDLARPQRWHSVSVADWAEADPVLLAALIGADARRRLAGLLASDRQPTVDEVTVDEVTVALAPTSPWLRVAAIDALDRWLHLDLDQTLVNAERAVARARAAKTFRPGPLRERFIGEALTAARFAANGLADKLSSLADSAAPLPTDLYCGLRRLANGYAALRREGVDGPEKELARVARAWAGLKSRVPVGGRVGEAYVGAAAEYGGSGEVAAGKAVFTSTVDPRQLPARVVGDGVSVTEIRMETVHEDAVLVTVPAFCTPLPSAVVTDRLLVRLVDRCSGEVRQTALLNLVTGDEADELGADAPVFARVVPLQGASPENVRADVFVADSDRVPVRVDTDEELLRSLRS
ncbi:MAG: hypothetical protein QOH84_1761, partial [Kribbellaceae bacterium]|nr:hypothetical protein [Kribbellaceae bacterium]